MTISELSQAILLLTAHLPGSDRSSPLSSTEYNRLAQWLVTRQASPTELLDPQRSKELLALWQDHRISTERLNTLLQRGGALALALDKWLRAGLWVVNRSDPGYPPLIKQRLKKNAPPLFFGVGDAKLLQGRAIGVVGSRDASDPDLALTRQLAYQLAQERYCVVSGGARGVDEAAMTGALDAKGTAVGFLADSLLKQAASKRYRDSLINGSLVLLSPYSPEARFNVGNAMARNKFIYLQSQATVVIHSGLKGGTWTGAEENLSQGWVPLWVKPDSAPETGNQKLIRIGGLPLPENPELWTAQFLIQPPASNQPDLFSPSQAQPGPPDQPPQQTSREAQALFTFFLEQIQAISDHSDFSLPLICQRLELTNDQAKQWLEKATAQGLLVASPEFDTFQWK